MTHLAAGRQRSVMARPMRPSMLVGVTRLHAAIATSTDRTATSLLFMTTIYVNIVGANKAIARAKLRSEPDSCRITGQLGSNAVSLAGKALSRCATAGLRVCGGVQAKLTVRVIFSSLLHPSARCFKPL